MKLTRPHPDYTRVVGSDSTVVCKLEFLAKEEITVRFLESVQVIIDTISLWHSKG